MNLIWDDNPSDLSLSVSFFLSKVRRGGLKIHYDLFVSIRVRWRRRFFFPRGSKRSLVICWRSFTYVLSILTSSVDAHLGKSDKVFGVRDSPLQLLSECSPSLGVKSKTVP